MLIPPDIIDRWISGNEDEHCEFKEAKYAFDKNELTDYCIALANEGGGHLILGVTDLKPRIVIGSQAFHSTLEELKHQLLQRIHFRVDVTEYYKDQKRIVIFHIPPRPIGTALQYQGRYLMRSGASLTSMTSEKIKEILSEGQIDFSAEICPKATIQDLDPNAIDILRKLWFKKSKDDEKLKKSDLEIIRDAELITPEGGITYAALILLGGKAQQFVPPKKLIKWVPSNGQLRFSK
ncbi:MAG: putative DNA binding domain-containing protein [Methanoregula sp.]|nr:putative DNA binding domain-containing protein [Methanoregula sp.]